ncbi:MAG: replicative DNA helicase [Solirubrobacterales bacterium]
MASATHVPPQNIEAEESVLGAMLVADSALSRVIDEVKLNGEDFYLEKHAAIFRAAHDLYAASKPVDELSVGEALVQRNEIDAAGGKHYVSELAAKVPAAGNAKHYAEIVQQNSLLRRLLGAGQEIQGWVHERDGEPRELSERAEKLLFDVAHKEQASDFRLLSEILHDEVDRLEKLSTGELEMTGTPSGFRDIDSITGGFQPGNLIIVAARPAMGKCQSAQSLVYDPRSGARLTVEKLYEAHRRGEEVWVASLASDLKMRPAKVAAIAANGPKKVFRLTTRLGRWTEATSNHPVLTSSGWEQLGNVAPGARIAVPRLLPRMGDRVGMPDEEIVLLAALIADGSIGWGTPAYCYGSESGVVDTVEAAATAYGVRFQPPRETAKGSSYLTLGSRSCPNPVTELLRSHGLFGRRSGDKFVPDAIFGLDDEQLARFLGVMYACDGHVYCSDRLAQIGYTTISERLAHDVQHLLLRLGIVATIRTLKRPVYDGTGKVAREIRITSQAGMRRFCELIQVPGKEEKQAQVLERLDVAPRMTNTDTVPPEVWEDVLLGKGGRPWADVSEVTGRPRTHNWHVGKRSPSRGLLTELAEATRSPALEELADSDIWWDEVASVEYVGEEETYDLDVPGLRNFVADDVIVHNSAIVANIAENVAVKRQMPVAFFSLEMSEVELAQRFIACRARISGDKLRKGQVAQKDWPKVVRACNELEEAPLWFDDSSDLGLLDLRAKARRLHAQTQDQGGLGLVIVDYLQLMRADDMRANRVEQVGQMSRGLKILARELEVPVLAISQLSRAPEQRTPAKPMLSDLRESGCLTGDSLVHLPSEGTRRPLRELVGREGFEVLAMDPETWRLRPALATRAFSTGHKQAFRLTTRLGRTVRATANHKFLTISGWRRLDELSVDDAIALPGTLPDTGAPSMTEDELALLGHLIGDGCTLPRHAIQYTSNEHKLANHVADLSLRVFGNKVKPRVKRERRWYQVYIAAAERLTHGRRNPVAAWLDELGVFGLRSHQKRVPDVVFRQPRWAIATFLRHLWATDGSVWLGGPKRKAVNVYYATSSRQLAADVQTLLLRLDINARVSRHEAPHKGRAQFHVTVSGGTELVRFLETVGALGARKGRHASAIVEHFEGRTRNPNKDVIPKEAWRALVVPAMRQAGVTSRRLQAAIDTKYCGSALYRSGLSRERAMRVASAVRCEELADLALGDAYWDPIVSIEPDGVEEVFDITVEGLHNFVADNIVVHNSIEQDADLVAFLYREDYYRDPEDEPDGLADVIIAKHRNGPIGAPKLVFLDRFPKFADFSGHERPVEQPAGEGPPLEDAAGAGPEF